MQIKIVGIIFIILISYSCSVIPILSRKEIKEKISSLVLTGYGKNSYTRGNVSFYLDELKLLKANTATFLYSCQTKTLRSNNIDCKSNYTPNLDSIKMAITMAKARGFEVSVRHYIDIENKKWRCYWNPKDKTRAFSNIKKELTLFAKTLEDYKVESFIIGAEYCKITGESYKHRWEDVIESIREKFKGKLSYGANWEKIHGNNEFYSTSFWEQLDFIGLDLYSPIPDHVKGSKIYNYQKNIIKNYVNFARKINKPIYINEIGFAGSSKGTSQPYEWRNKTPGPEERQAEAYKYTLKALKSFDDIKGIFIWRKLATKKQQMLKYNPKETDYDLWKRKAWYEIKKNFTNL